MGIDKDNTIDHMLSSNLRACGHFLYYQTGGKVGQRRILLALLEHEDITQRELQDILKIRSGSLSEILAKIEEDRYIKREKSDEDKRQVKLVLTESGRNKAFQMEEDYERLVRKMFECLSKEEKERLLIILKKLVKNWGYLKTDRTFEMIAKEFRNETT
ncbi:MAG TPA: hypothetical protein DD426_13385 [Clostridiaceae bacterium]|nr:hypothetical protein [Clostridiaceae bacterium]